MMENIQFIDKPTHKRFQDIEGQTFNRLTIIGYAGKIGFNHYWWCKCSCKYENPNYKKVSKGNLDSESVKSCGCYNSECVIKRQMKHGMSKSTEYYSYRCAKNRCLDNENDRYLDYGGRGIEFRFNSFEEFYEELGEIPEPKDNYSLDRINVDGHYEKGNVKWATNFEQARNRRDNIWITYNHETKILTDWANEFNIHPSTLYSRIYLNNWCISCSLRIKVAEGVCKHK